MPLWGQRQAKHGGDTGFDDSLVSRERPCLKPTQKYLRRRQSKGFLGSYMTKVPSHTREGKLPQNITQSLILKPHMLEFLVSFNKTTQWNQYAYIHTRNAILHHLLKNHMVSTLSTRIKTIKV